MMRIFRILKEKRKVVRKIITKKITDGIEEFKEEKDVK